jgi:hypothetical protein
MELKFAEQTHPPMKTASFLLTYNFLRIYCTADFTFVLAAKQENLHVLYNQENARTGSTASRVVSSSADQMLAVQFNLAAIPLHTNARKPGLTSTNQELANVGSLNTSNTTNEISESFFENYHREFMMYSTRSQDL